MKKLYHYMLGLSLAYAMTSCQKDEMLGPDETTGLKAQLESRMESKPLDWENIDYMPTPYPTSAIRAPWKAGNSKRMPEEIVNDYKKEDGWVLLYNTFSTEVDEKDKYFMLYNKYRGVVRLYYYSDSGIITSDNMVHTITGIGSHKSLSPILNFSDQEIVDFSANSITATKAEKEEFSGQNWYAFEYELAYDKNMSSYNSSALGFKWNIAFVDIQDLIINGTSVGEAQLPNLSSQGHTLGLNPSINITDNSNSGVIFRGVADVRDKASKPGSWITQAVKDGLEKGIVSGVSGLVSNVLSGIFTKKKDQTQDIVNMKMKSTITMTGSMTAGGALDQYWHDWPGYGSNQFSTSYNKPLGVFYVSHKPTIKEEINYYVRRDSWGNEIPGSYVTNYTLVPDNFRVEINPEILANATVTDQKIEIVMGGNYDKITGKDEFIGEFPHTTGASISIREQGYSGNIVGVRVSFVVRPKDGSPSVLHVKTFKAHVSTQYINHEPTPGGGEEDS